MFGSEPSPAHCFQLSLSPLSLLLARSLSHSGVFREKPNWERGGGKRVFFFLPSLLFSCDARSHSTTEQEREKAGQSQSAEVWEFFGDASHSQTLTPNTRHAATLLFPVTVLLLHLLLHLPSASRWTDSRRRSERRGRSRDDPGDVHADHLQGAL